MFSLVSYTSIRKFATEGAVTGGAILGKERGVMSSLMFSRLSGMSACLAAGALLVSAGASQAAVIVNGDVTAPGDPIVGVTATPGSNMSALATEGGSAGSGNMFPMNEAPPNAIDNDTGTKYLNFSITDASGIITTVATNGPQAILTGFRFTTANDSEDRDPATVVVEGSNGANATTSLNSTWVPIYNGNAGIDTDPGRNSPASQVNFTTPSSPYSSFRVLVTSTRAGAAQGCCTQFAEIELIGNSVPVPEPTSAALLGLGAVGLLARRRRHG